MPKNAVFVFHHVDSAKDHLSFCIKSILASDLSDTVVVIASDAETDISAQEPFLVINDKGLDTTQKKISKMLELVSGMGVETLMFVSDDIILSKGCIRDICELSRAANSIIAPLQSNELGVSIYGDIEFNKGNKTVSLKRGLSIEDAEAFFGEISGYSESHFVFSMNWVSFCCVALPKKTYERLGGLDPALEYRHNDEDFCYRARQEGVKAGLFTGALAYHFGSVTFKAIGDIKEKMEACSQSFLEKTNAIMNGAVS